MRSAIATSIFIATVAATVSGIVPIQGGGVPVFDPGDFQDPQENPYFPLRPGTVLIYKAQTSDGVEKGLFHVTNQTKTIMGVEVTVIHDREFLDGELVEDTFDWYAADNFGNVWYFGEDTREIEDGEVVSTSGSWEAGQDGAMPGVIMLANPQVGITYKEEDRPGQAEDMARVVHLNKTVKAPNVWPFLWPLHPTPGKFHNVIKTRNWNPLDPGPVEWKYYAPGVGSVLEVTRDGDEREVKRLVGAVMD